MSLELVQKPVDEQTGESQKPIWIKIGGKRFELSFTTGVMMDLIRMDNLDLHALANEKAPIIASVVRRSLDRIIVQAARNEKGERLLTHDQIRDLDHTQIGPLSMVICARLVADFESMNKAIAARDAEDANENPLEPPAGGASADGLSGANSTASVG